MASCRKVALVKGENRYSNTYNALNLIKPDLEKLKIGDYDLLVGCDAVGRSFEKIVKNKNKNQ